MADSSAPAPAPPTEAVANMHLDSVTGEMVSKSELKKRQKNRERDAKKAEKAAAAPPKPVAAKKDNAEADEKALDPRQYFEIRSRAINKCASPPSLSTSELRLLTIDYDVRKFTTDFGHLKSGEHNKDKILRVGARIYNKRASGSKLVFYDVRVEGVKVQVMCQAQEVTGDVSFDDQHLHLR
ncbi:hypothetical protein BN1723_016944, partial [Verticillium longisporum]